MSMSEEELIVGRKGEIFTSKKLRTKVGIKEGGRVRANVVEGKLIIDPIPSLEELLHNPVLVTEVGKTERLSEEAQREHGVYG